mmetsp:Transcript_41735/g.104152  ORF Transcript_41735/g.104152 Transcript_41735/m.104152 type:complete len:256 (+) Transcript_41735:146-913(+)
MKRRTAAVCLGGLAVATASWCWLAIFEPALLTRMRRGVWVVYLLPFGPRHIWDSLHASATNEGGLWHYEKNVHREFDDYISKTHQDFRSLWDTSCNTGFLLTCLAQKYPEARHYGSDISPLMVNVTKRRCDSRCIVAPFDLFSMQDPDSRLPRGFPPAFDLVIVSDVLFYGNWGGLPPLVWQYSLLPSWLVASRRRAFWNRLTHLACSEVLLSNHQKNRAVLRLMVAMGATPVLPDKLIWTAKGTAAHEACNGRV